MDPDTQVPGPGNPAAAPKRAENELAVTVSAKEYAADGVVTLTLTRTGGGDLPAWDPGAHLDLLLASDLERQYSLCGDPKDRQQWRIAVLRETGGRGGSAYVHDQLAVGDALTVRGPRNHFQLDPSPRYLFIAGGIGITPILPMITSAESAGSDWKLLYGGREAESMAFAQQLATFDDRVRFWPENQYGLLPLDEVLGASRQDTLVYCCGPEPLLQAVEQHCLGWPAGALHVERFSATELAEPARQDAFRVVCSRSAISVDIPPECSVLETLEEAGAPVPSSCREGTCGTCESVVLKGRPDHRDSVLTPEEQESGEMMMICVSRSLDDELVLDI